MTTILYFAPTNPEILVGAIALGALILVTVGVLVIDRIGEGRP